MVAGDFVVTLQGISKPPWTRVVGCKMKNFQNTTGLCFLVEFWPNKTKISRKFFFSNSVSSPWKLPSRANLALIFVNYYRCSKLELIIWILTIILFIILYFLSVCVCVCVCVCMCVCVFTLIHHEGFICLEQLGLPGNRSTMLYWRRWIPLPVPFISTLECRT